MSKRICIIGAGPSGMSALYHFAKMHEDGEILPELVCYEKQSEWTGLWNYDWRTGQFINAPSSIIYIFINII